MAHVNIKNPRLILKLDNKIPIVIQGKINNIIVYFSAYRFENFPAND